MQNFKKDITKEQVKKIISTIDNDQSGKISMEEFIKLMS
jgi:Ca2+-binding EF-hand superfamily protein